MHVFKLSFIFSEQIFYVSPSCPWPCWKTNSTVSNPVTQEHICHFWPNIEWNHCIGYQNTSSIFNQNHNRKIFYQPTTILLLASPNGWNHHWQKNILIMFFTIQTSIWPQQYMWWFWDDVVPNNQTYDYLKPFFTRKICKLDDRKKYLLLFFYLWWSSPQVIVLKRITTAPVFCKSIRLQAVISK